MDIDPGTLHPQYISLLLYVVDLDTRVSRMAHATSQNTREEVGQPFLA